MNLYGIFAQIVEIKAQYIRYYGLAQLLKFSKKAFDKTLNEYTFDIEKTRHSHSI